MDSHRFSTKIEDLAIVLKNVADISRFSFIVQDSVSYLDLTHSNSSSRWDNIRSSCGSCRSLRSTYFANTEERCRLFFAPRRRLLYTLHLDLPKGRECSLKEDVAYSFSSRECCRHLHVAKVTFDREGFYLRSFSSFIEEALSNNVGKQKILQWTLQLSLGEVPLLSRLNAGIAAQLVICFHPKMSDVALFHDFMRHFDVVAFMRTFELPQILERLLYHARLFGNRSLESKHKVGFIEDHIFLPYRNIGPILKYISEFEPSYSSFSHYVSRLLTERLDLSMLPAAALITATTRTRRSCFLWQLFFARVDSQNGLKEAASEALRLVWSSVPDVFLSYDELRDVFGSSLSEAELMSMFEFYAEAVGEFHERAEPRSLQHLCRTVLRRRFRERGAWIPEAIRQTGLPKSLQSFLNLETTFAV